MIHRSILQIPELQDEIQWNDEITGELRSGIVGKVEYLDETTAFVYVIDSFDLENNKEIEPQTGMPGQPGFMPGFTYADIIVFDDKPNNIEGWARDSIKENYDKYTDSPDYDSIIGEIKK